MHANVSGTEFYNHKIAKECKENFESSSLCSLESLELNMSQNRVKFPYLDVREVNPGEISHHLLYLCGVNEDSTCCLSKVIERCVSA